MRSFSKKEQSVIKHIVTHASNTLQYVLFNAYYDVFYKNRVSYNIKDPSNLNFYRNYENINLDEILSVQQEIIIQSRLIQYLVDNRLIYLIETKSVNENEIGNIVPFSTEGLTRVSYQIDPITADILKKSVKYYVIVTEDLKKLVANDFVSEEERRHQEQLQKSEEACKTAIKSYKVALCALIASIIIPFISAFFNPISLNKSQYNEIISNINTSKTTKCDSSKSIEFVNSIQTSNDSLKPIEFVNSIKTSNDSLKSIEFANSIKISNDNIWN